MFNVGGGEILAILVIALIVLGPDKLPNAARQAGKYLNEFRRISSGFQDEIRGAMDLATTPDPTPVKMEPAEPAPDDPEAQEEPPVEAADEADVTGPADPGIATETVANASDPTPARNGSTAAPVPVDPSTAPATDDPLMPTEPAPSPTIAPSAEVAEAELAVTQARLAAAQAELAEAEAKLALARSQPVTDPGAPAPADADDEAGSVPPDSARA